ncbi:hypothetical protein KC19_8G079800 [Ceratodon purpureus]|uniref:OVATE domain-containing protein n=1 Tax=Ceratodon purpureus TaxID=3225 RepID=A0A8T0H1U6_CERPU|nr:hypothetical protein KC19_8G079800 [Ceratodon purpureus]
MGDIEKPKEHLVNKVLPETWFIKFLRPVWRKPHRGLIDLVDAHDSGSVNRGHLVVENIYKYRANGFSRFEASPNFTNATDMNKASSAGASPKPEDSLLRAFSKSKSYVHPDEVDETSSRISSTSHGRRKSFSFFSSATFSSIGRLCSVAGDESSLSPDEGSCRSKHTSSSRKGAGPAPGPTRSPWFLLGCGSFSSRNRRSRHGSMEHLKKAGLLELDIENTEPACTEAGTLKAEEAVPDAYIKAESWTGDDPKVWSMDLTTYGEVVKCLVDDGKSSPSLNQKSSTLGDLFSETETDDAPMIRPHSEDEFEDFDPARPWSSSMSSLGSSREFWKTEKKSRNISECNNALVPYSGELDSVDIGNISDSQSLLRAKVFGAEMFRKQCQLEKTREEETKRLLLSLDQALDQYNHKRITEEDDSKCESPNYELFNSPVFESFLESSTKAWGTDSLPLRLTDGDSKTPEPIRELHCVTVQSPNLIMSSPQGHLINFVQKDISPNGNSIQDYNFGSVAGKGRKTSKPPVESAIVKKRSPSICEDRIHHPQGEENMILNFARLQIDELSSRKKRFNKPRRGYKQQSLKQPSFNGAESSTVSPRPPLPAGNVIKESVAVVVESSYDPYGDFRESMIDMIVDQNIQQTTDLEELLQCYLALNEPDYHQVIIEVFSDVWHELFQNKT